MSDGFEAIGEGRFRVDRGRALEKMERFQLEDPERYVLELVAAAVCAGTSAIDIANDADDFVLSYRGETPSQEELALLWDHLFARDATGRAAMLQHLATGVLGALATEPRWIHLDIGEDDESTAVRLVVEDVMRTDPVPLDDRTLVGTRVHVRERVTRRVFSEALLRAFQHPSEARLVQGACGWSPVPIRINGAPLPSRVAPADAVAEWRMPGDRPGQLWLLPPDVPGSLDVVRHGLVVAHLEVAIGRCVVVGWVGGDELRLNASRSAVVADERQQALQHDVDGAVVELIEEVAPPLVTGVEGLEVLRWTGHADAAHLRYRATRAEVLRQVVVEGLLAGRQGKGLQIREKLAVLPLVEDLTGRVWSPGELASLRYPPGVLSDPALLDERLGRVQFSAAHRGLLEALSGQVEDLSEVCQARADGRRRRAAAARSRREPWFGGHEQRFEEGLLRGAVRLQPQREARRQLRVHLRIDGLTVQTRVLSARVGALEAIVDHPELQPDHAFLRVLDTPVLTKALARVQDVCSSFLTKELARGVRGRQRDRWMLVWVDLLLEAKPSSALLRKCIDALGETLTTIAGLRAGDGRWLSLRDLVEAPVTKPWWVLEPGQATALPTRLRDQVLLVPDGERGRWRRVLKGCSRRGARESLDKAALRAERLSRPRREPAFAKPGPVHVRFERHGISGMFCYLPPQARSSAAGSEGPWHGDFTDTAREVRATLGRPGDAEARIGLLRGGVFIEARSLRCGLAGVSGWVDWAQAPVDDAMGALRPQGVDRLAQLVEELVDELASRAWSWWRAQRPDGWIPDDLALWLVKRRKHRKDVARLLGDAVLATTSGGEPFTVADLNAARRGREPLVLAERPPPAGLPGIGEVLVCRGGAAAAVRAWAKGKVVDGDARIAAAHIALAAFLRESTAPDPAKGLAQRQRSGDMGSWHFVLPEDPGTIGVLTVEVRWRGRVLHRRGGSRALGAAVVVEGPAFAPSQDLRGVADPGALKQALARGREALGPLVEQALGSGLGSDECWRALASRAWDEGRPGSKALRSSGVLASLISRPMFTRIDGGGVSAQTLRQLRADGALVGWVTDQVLSGPSDHPGLVREEPYARAALEHLVGKVSCADDALAAWRQAEARRRSLPRLEPVLTEVVVCRAPLPAPLTGEVGLTTGEGGLLVQPLVEGLALEAVRIDFPVAARAIVQGPAVRGDATLSSVQADEAWEGALDRIRRLAGELADGLCLQTMRRTEQDQVAWRWALGNRRRSRTVRRASVFPTRGGLVSFHELERREHRDGGVGVVSSDGPSLPGSVQPVCLDRPPLAALLEERFLLVELDHVAAHVTDRSWATEVQQVPRRVLWAWLLLQGEGLVGWIGLPRVAGARPRIRLQRCGVTLHELELGCPLPLVGQLEVDSLEPAPLWRWVAREEDIASVRARLTQTARTLMQQLVDELPRQSQVRQPLREGLRLALDDAADLDGKPSWLRRAAQLPLYHDSTGAKGTLQELLAQTPVRTVAEGASGRWHPSRARVWRVSEAERRWLERLVGAVDATRELAAEELGHRRQDGPVRRLEAPSRAHWFAMPDAPVRGAFWDADHLGGVDVFVRGHHAGTVDLAGPRVHGVVEGPFRTTVSFTDPVLGEEVLAFLQEELASWLSTLSVRSSWPLLVHAVEAWGSRRAAGGHQAHPLRGVNVALDARGKPISFARLDQVARTHQRLLWVEEDGAVLDAPEDELVIMDRDGAIDRLRRLFGDVAFVHVADRIELEGLPERAGEHQALEAMRAEVEALACSWGMEPMAVQDAARAWFGESGAPMWLLAATQDPRVGTLAAWRIATHALGSELSRGAELTVLSAVLAGLNEA